MTPNSIAYEIPAEAIIAEANRQEAERAAAEVQAIRQATARTVGRFTYDPATGMVQGPADYMHGDSYRRRMAAIQAGTDTVAGFSYSQNRDVVSAILVSLQTDYAAWLGFQEIEAMQRTSR